MSFAKLMLVLLVGCSGDPATPSNRGSSTTPTEFAQPPADAAATPGGYRYVVLSPGRDLSKPRPDALLNFYYTARTTTGEILEDRTVGRPAMYALDNVIEGWRESLAVMTQGMKLRVWIPERGRVGGGWKQPGTLVFDLELIEIVGP